MKSYKSIISFSIILSCLLVLTVSTALAVTVENPIIMGVEDGSSKNKPLIKGTTQSGTLVHIYIDGVYNGKTDVLFNDLGTAGIAYESFINLSSGDHRVWAIAEDESGNRSKLSNIFKFNILPGVPAPTLFQPAINKNNIAHPFIVGISKNDLTIKVFIDNEFDGEFKVENHESGSASFSYEVKKFLARGQHLSYVTAIDNHGEESQKSNIVNFNLAQPVIAESVDEERNRLGEGITDEDINKLLQSGVKEEENNEENKDGLSPSTIIFIFFIIGIVGWIIWVNRALIKEKKTSVKKDTNKNDTDKMK